jgi:glycosyltransferase involved in cell wall biosynthesis
MTVPVTLFFLSGQASFMRRSGFEVHAIASPGDALQAFGEQEEIAVHAVAMTRSITPAQDLRALWRLWRVLRRIRPRIVHAHTPKGGLLGMLAAWLVGAPVRIYHMRGLPFVTATGLRRRLLRAVEGLSCSLAHRVLAISHSTRAIAVEEGICDPGKIRVVLGGGNGVDADRRFVPNGDATRSSTRARHGIPADALVIGFVGRLARDKGVVELARAWERIRETDPRVHLLLVGPLEEENAVPADVVAGLQGDARVHLTGLDWETPPLYSAMDVVALPTYREGFPNVPLEAAAMALPLVATRIPGCVDAVLDGVTGTLVPPRDASALAAALLRYLADPALRARHGEAGRRRVLADFRREAIWEALREEYRSLLEGPPPGSGDRRRLATHDGS